MDQLLPVLFDRVYLILGQPANGTDDVLVQAELRKAYLTFLTTIFQAGLHQILLSPSAYHGARLVHTGAYCPFPPSQSTNPDLSRLLAVWSPWAPR
jgi:hypothetical protein